MDSNKSRVTRGADIDATSTLKYEHQMLLTQESQIALGIASATHQLRLIRTRIAEVEKQLGIRPTLEGENEN